MGGGNFLCMFFYIFSSIIFDVHLYLYEEENLPIAKQHKNEKPAAKEMKMKRRKKDI